MDRDYHGHGGDGCSLGSSDSDKGNECYRVLEVPPALTATQDSSHGSACRGGGGGCRAAGDADGKFSADGCPNGMSDMVRFLA